MFDGLGVGFAASCGAAVSRLESTETARRFCRSNGYAETGAATQKFGARSGYRMTKSLH